MKPITISILLLSLAVAPGIGADDAAPKDTPETSPAPAADKPAASKPLQATVIDVVGKAYWKDMAAASPKPQLVKKGDRYGESVIILTGLGAKVVLDMAGQGQTTIKSSTKAGIKTLRVSQVDNSTVVTTVGMKYGRMTAEVDSSKRPNDYKVETGDTVAAARGTGGSFAHSDRGTGIRSTSHTWNARRPGGSTKVVQGGEVASSGSGGFIGSRTLQIRTLDTQMGDPNGGTTGIEAANLAVNGGGRGIIGYSGGTGQTGSPNSVIVPAPTPPTPPSNHPSYDP